MSNWPAASAQSLIPKRAHSIDSVRIMFSTAARAAPECDHAGHPVVRREGDADHLAGALRDERLGRRGMGHLPGPLNVELDHGPKALRADRLGRAEELTAGVVDEHVDAAVALDDPVEQARRPRRRRGCPWAPPPPCRPPRESRSRCPRAARRGARSPPPSRPAPRARAKSPARGQCLPRRPRTPGPPAGRLGRSAMAALGHEPEIIRGKPPARGRPGSGIARGQPRYADPPMKLHAEPKPLTEPLAGGEQGTTVTVEPLLGRRDASPLVRSSSAPGAAWRRSSCWASAHPAPSGGPCPVPLF